MTVLDEPNEGLRLAGVYDRLRLKLLDLSKKNRMLNYNLSARSKRHLQIVDEVMEEVYRKLAGEDVSLRIDPLEEPEDTTPEERTEEFIAALEHAKVSNLEYLTKLQALESSGRDDEPALAKLERELQVGVSGYRIDLGVRHPDHPERYLAGIECDGATYHSSKSARDRDRLREEVLTDKGWDIVRIWSTDWFDNPDLQTERLVARLEALRRQPAESPDDFAFRFETHQVGQADGRETARASAEATDLAPYGDGVAEVQIGTIDDPLRLGVGSFSEKECFEALHHFRSHVIAAEMPEWDPNRSLLRDAMIETFVRQRFADPDEWFEKVPGYLRQGTNAAEKNRYLERICEIVSRLYPGQAHSDSAPAGSRGSTDAPGGPSSGFGTDAGPATSGQRDGTEYSPTNFSELGLRPKASKFYDHDYESVLQKMVAHVLRHESPIYEDLLIERIARAHGFQRSGDPRGRWGKHPRQQGRSRSSAVFCNRRSG